MSHRAFRLPSHVRPRLYDIDIQTDPSRTDFVGQVRMQLELREATQTIILHSRELALRDATVTVGQATQSAVQPAAIAYQPEQQTVTLTTADRLPAGPVEVTIGFAGKLAASMHGIYLATDGVHRAVCTQCEATDARAIFPCFDEPEFKAQLKWTIRTSPDLLALANGPEESREEPTAGGPRVFHFAATKPVSSYLAALAIGDLECGPETTANGIPLRVYAPRGKGSQTAFAQELTGRLLPWYENYFDLPYPFVKYDQVAVPGFDAGAMENIGLVLFRQNLLLMDPKSASWRQEKTIARVVAHEMAHMWFGNVVTMHWWDDLWLNEAFAEWMAHKACHAVQPSYKIWDDFAEDKGRALFDDALGSTHSIYAPVATPEEALEMFDSITYQKGCAVMRMLENFLGEEPFRSGLRAYMKKYQYANAAGADLWAMLAEASGQPVGQLMKSWVEQPGFPLIDFDLVTDANGSRLELKQRRFYSDPRATASNQRWSVPLVVRYEDDSGVRTHRFIMHEASHVEKLPSQGPIRWCHPNADDIGFYRVRLAGHTLTSLLSVGLAKLSASEQVGVLEDQWALVRSGQLEIGQFIDVLRAVAVGREHNVLRAVLDRLDAIDLIVKDSGHREARLKLRALVASMLQSQLDELGFEPKPGEEQNDTQRRALLVAALGSIARVPDVISSAERYASIEQQDPHAVDPNLAGIFVALAAKFGDAVRYDSWIRTFLERKSAGRTPQEVARYLHTLSSFRVPGLAERTLRLMDEGTIPQEALSPVLGQLLAARHAQEAAWSFFQERWSSLRDRVGDLGLSRAVEAVGRLPAKHRDDVVRFFERNPPLGAERALSRALERMDQGEELRARVTPGLLDYLAKL